MLSPSPWVVRFAPLVSPGSTLLDVACGSGRHARYFAARGALVTAVDRDAEALAVLAGSGQIEAVVADLEGAAWPFAGRQFDAIVVTNYLHRPLMLQIVAALAPGGLLLYETFAEGQQRFGRPTNPDFLLQPGELLKAATGLHVLAYEDGVIGRPPLARVQRIAAIASGAADGQGGGDPLARLLLGAP